MDREWEIVPESIRKLAPTSYDFTVCSHCGFIWLDEQPPYCRVVGKLHFEPLTFVPRTCPDWYRDYHKKLERQREARQRRRR